jgi:CheY-like chemotaxis protein
LETRQHGRDADEAVPHCRVPFVPGRSGGGKGPEVLLPGPEEAHRHVEWPRRAVGVLTVDDDAAFREVAREVIDATPGFEAVGEAATGEAAVGLVPVLMPQLVLMDVRMPGMGGVEAARRIAQSAGARVAVILMSADTRLLDAAAATPRCQAGVLRKDRLSPAALRALWPVARAVSARA